MNDEQLALLRTMKYGVLSLRILGYQGQQQGLTKQQSEIIADLADAIHNIPEAIESKSIDLKFHTNTMLGGFSQKYKNNPDAPDLLNMGGS